MRVVLIGVSHWHTPFFLNPCLEMADVAIVGVCDPDLARTEQAAAKGEQEEVRQHWPFLRDRRIDSYAPIVHRWLGK